MRVIAEDLWFPEGPVWVGDGSMLVVEIRRRTLTQIWLDGRKRIVAELGGGPNGAAIGPDGHAYVCNNGGFAFRQRPDGRWVTHGTPDDYDTGRIERVNLATGKVFADLGLPPMDPATDRAMICGSLAFNIEVKAILEGWGLREGANSDPKEFVVEKAFVGEGV